MRKNWKRIGAPIPKEEQIISGPTAKGQLEIRRKEMAPIVQKIEKEYQERMAEKKKAKQSK